MQASAKAMRLRAQGIATDAAFLDEEGAALVDEGEREAAELAAAEGQFQAQLKKEVGVSPWNPFLPVIQALQGMVLDVFLSSLLGTSMVCWKANAAMMGAWYVVGVFLER